MTDAQRRAELIRQGMEQAYQQLHRIDADALAELERLYRAVAEHLTQMLGQYGTDGYFEAQYLQPFLALLEQFLQSTAATRASLLDHSLASAAVAASAPALLAGASSSAVDLAVAASVKAVYELQLADGLQLSDRLWRIDRSAKEAVGAALRQSIAQGAHPLQSAREFLRTGKGIPPDLLAKITGLQTGNLQQMIGEKLLTGQGNALYNVQRVFQTETTRAHALAYVKSNDGLRGLVGYRFRLSPLHKRTDICDTLAAADDYGLGKGVYPADQIMDIYPAHPNTRSYIVAIYQ